MMTLEQMADELVGRIVGADLLSAEAKELILPALQKVAALEREACARIADGHVADSLGGENEGSAAVWKAAGEIASEIRSRGQ